MSTFEVKEGSPLLPDFIHNQRSHPRKGGKFILGLVALATALGVYLISSFSSRASPSSSTVALNDKNIKKNIVQIHDANENTIDIGNGLSLWYRTWGNKLTGIPVLFVHGGPGNAISDYKYVNGEIFDADTYFVVEVDQRGTGKSQPSVREDQRNMKYYKGISIDQMSADFEKVREALKIEEWLVFGGSWGSTLGLDYALRYPQQTLGIILRGVFLNTQEEMNAFYTRKAHEKYPRHLKEFDTFYELAEKEAASSNQLIDPNDAESIIRLYARMISRGDEDAIWRWFVFEENLMEVDPAKRQDPHVIVPSLMPEARSVSFFESRLFIHGAYEEPIRFLNRLDRLLKGKSSIHTWICQGARDAVCPEKFALRLVLGMAELDLPHTAHFWETSHLVEADGMMDCLKGSLDDFVEKASFTGVQNYHA